MFQCNPNPTGSSIPNPYDGRKYPWQINIEDDPIEKALQHITADSYFTAEVLKVSPTWLKKASTGNLTDDELKPGLSQYLRFVNDVAERLVKSSEETAKNRGGVYNNLYSSIKVL